MKNKFLSILCFILISLCLSAVVAAEEDSSKEIIYSTSNGWNPNVQKELVKELSESNGTETELIEKFLQKYTVQTDNTTKNDMHIMQVSAIKTDFVAYEEFQIDDSKFIIFHPDGRFDLIECETEELESPSNAFFSKAISMSKAAPMKYVRKTVNQSINDVIRGPLVKIQTVGEFGYDGVNTPTIVTSYSNYQYTRVYGVNLLQLISSSHTNDVNNQELTATINSKHQFGLKAGIPFEVSFLLRNEAFVSMKCYKNGQVGISSNYYTSQ
jgi:hypothetical protein